MATGNIRTAIRRACIAVSDTELTIVANADITSSCSRCQTLSCNEEIELAGEVVVIFDRAANPATRAVLLGSQPAVLTPRIMRIRHSVAGMLSIGLLVLGAKGMYAQPYPNKPIRIVTSEPGGGNDFAARLIASGLGSNLGQHVIVDNRVGILSMPTVAHALPNGYTLLLYTNGMWTAPLIQPMPWDPVRDFS